MTKFRFDEETHTYWLGDKRIIGVSEVIESCGFKTYEKVNPTVLKHAQDRGKAVHLACQYLDEGTLDWKSVSEEIIPYVLAWKKFKDEIKPEFLEIEKPCYSEQYDFAGKPDRIMKGNVVLDIKTYKPDVATGLQLAGYELLKWGIPVNYPIRLVVWLKSDEKYSTYELENTQDHSIFLSCLNVCRFKLDKGVLA